MAGFAINPAQATRIDPLNNPYFGTGGNIFGGAPSGNPNRQGYTQGGGNGLGVFDWSQLAPLGYDVSMFAPQAIGDDGSPAGLDPRAAADWLASNNLQFYEQAAPDGNMYRYMTDPSGSVVGTPQFFNTDDDAFWTAAMLATAVTGANIYAAQGAGGLGAASAAPDGGISSFGTPWTQSPDFGVIAASAPEAGTVGGTVAGNGINFGANGAASLYTPTGFAGGTGTALGTAAPTAGGWTLGNTLTAAQLASGLVGGYVNGQAAGDASAAQQAAAQQGITAQQQALAQITQQLAPYTQAGPGALRAQQDLAGLNGPQAQQAAIEALKASPQFTSQQQMGEERILANASATGGLRGGNVQAALAQFSPALLSQTINDQYSRLGGLVNVGQNSAAGVGTATMGTANNVSNLLQQQGAAAAGGALARGRQTAGYIGAITNAIGLYYGITGGF